MYRSGDNLQNLVFSFLPVSPGGLSSGCEGFCFCFSVKCYNAFHPFLQLEGVYRGYCLWLVIQITQKHFRFFLFMYAHMCVCAQFAFLRQWSHSVHVNYVSEAGLEFLIPSAELYMYTPAAAASFTIIFFIHACLQNHSFKEACKNTWKNVHKKTHQR